MMGTPRGNGGSGGGAALSGGEANSPRVVGQGMARGGVRGTRPLPAQDQGDPTLAVHYLPRRCLVIEQVGSQLLLHLPNSFFLGKKIVNLPGGHLLSRENCIFSTVLCRPLVQNTVGWLG